MSALAMDTPEYPSFAIPINAEEAASFAIMAMKEPSDGGPGRKQGFR